MGASVHDPVAPRRRVHHCSCQTHAPTTGEAAPVRSAHNPQFAVEFKGYWCRMRCLNGRPARLVRGTDALVSLSSSADLRVVRLWPELRFSRHLPAYGKTCTTA